MKNFLQPPSTEIPQRLLVKPLGEAGDYQWVQIEKGGVKNSIAEGTLQQLAELRETMPGCELVLLLPAGEAALRTLPITDAERKLYRQMLPYALEDSLVQSAEDLHFAYCPLAEDRMGVVLVDYSTMQNRLQQFRDTGLVVDVVLPEILLLPWSAQQETWTLQQGELVARTGSCAGFAAPLEALELVADLPDTDGNEASDRILLVAEQGSDSDRAMAVFSARGREAELHPVEHMLVWQASVLPEDPFTMLQGDFQPPLRWRQYWNEWKPIAVACLVALLLNYGVLLFHHASVARTAETLEAEKYELVRKAIPSGKISSPERQLRAALSRINTSGPTDFGPLLATVGPALSGELGYTVRTINYDGSSGSLRLEIRTRDFQKIEQFRSQMQDKGLQAQLLNSSSQGEGIVARLELKGGGR